jgi:hypothetical protein
MIRPDHYPASSFIPPKNVALSGFILVKRYELLNQTQGEHECKGHVSAGHTGFHFAGLLLLAGCAKSPKETTTQLVDAMRAFDYVTLYSCSR